MSWQTFSTVFVGLIALSSAAFDGSYQAVAGASIDSVGVTFSDLATLRQVFSASTFSMSFWFKYTYSNLDLYSATADITLFSVADTSLKCSGFILGFPDGSDIKCELLINGISVAAVFDRGSFRFSSYQVLVLSYSRETNVWAMGLLADPTAGYRTSYNVIPALTASGPLKVTSQGGAFIAECSIWLADFSNDILNYGSNTDNIINKHPAQTNPQPLVSLYTPADYVLRGYRPNADYFETAAPYRVQPIQSWAVKLDQ